MTPKRIVIADGTDAVRERFRAALSEAGHEAVTVKSAGELLARVRGDLDRIDLLLVDLRLSAHAGVELVQGIRRLDAGRLPVVIFARSIDRAEEIRDLTALGVVGYLNGQCAADQILPIVTQYLARS